MAVAIRYSIEVLHHFQCLDCMKWWSIADHQTIDTGANMLCPHCGCSAKPEKFTEGRDAKL